MQPTAAPGCIMLVSPPRAGWRPPEPPAPRAQHVGRVMAPSAGLTLGGGCSSCKWFELNLLLNGATSPPGLGDEGDEGAVPQPRAPSATRQPGVACAGSRDNGSSVTCCVYMGSAFSTGVEWPLVLPAHAGRSPSARTCACLGCMVTLSHLGITQAGTELATGPTLLFCPLLHPPQR